MILRSRRCIQSVRLVYCFQRFSIDTVGGTTAPKPHPAWQNGQPSSMATQHFCQPSSSTNQRADRTLWPPAHVFINFQLSTFLLLFFPHVDNGSDGGTPSRSSTLAFWQGWKSPVRIPFLPLRPNVIHWQRQRHWHWHPDSLDTGSGPGLDKSPVDLRYVSFETFVCDC